MTRSWRNVSTRSARPQPTMVTSYQPCSIARVPTARSMRFGMCSRRFMGAIASRSSSNGRARVGDRARRGVPGGRVKEASPLDGALQRLSRIQTKHPVVTCYLKLEPRDRTRGKYLIKVKNRVKDAIQALPRLGLERAASEAVERDLERV